MKECTALLINVHFFCYFNKNVAVLAVWYRQTLSAQPSFLSLPFHLRSHIPSWRYLL